MVVIGIIAVVAAFVGPNMGTWNCKQEIKTDADIVNDFLEMAKNHGVERLNDKGYLESKGLEYMNTQVLATVEGDTMNLYLINKGTCRKSSPAKKFHYRKLNSKTKINSFSICFNLDGSSSGGEVMTSRLCGDENIQIRNTVYGATSYIVKERNNHKLNRYEEL